MISLFDMFKVGIGPSSSHTVGPMKAGKQFVDDLVEKGLLDSVTRVAVDVYGSLSLTGKGHHTDIAIIMGLAGNEPATVDIDSIPGFIRDVEERERLLVSLCRTNWRCTARKRSTSISRMSGKPCRHVSIAG